MHDSLALRVERVRQLNWMTASLKKHHDPGLRPHINKFFRYMAYVLMCSWCRVLRDWEIKDHGRGAGLIPEIWETPTAVFTDWLFCGFYERTDQIQLIFFLIIWSGSAMKDKAVLTFSFIDVFIDSFTPNVAGGGMNLNPHRLSAPLVLQA